MVQGTSRRLNKIAKAVLYEGYMLYPYRPSSVKNQQRWNFGVLCPQSYSEAQKGGEAWTMQTECLVEGEFANHARNTDSLSSVGSAVCWRTREASERVARRRNTRVSV